MTKNPIGLHNHFQQQTNSLQKSVVFIPAAFTFRWPRSSPVTIKDKDGPCDAGVIWSCETTSRGWRILGLTGPPVHWQGYSCNNFDPLMILGGILSDSRGYVLTFENNKDVFRLVYQQIDYEESVWLEAWL